MKKKTGSGKIILRVFLGIFIYLLIGVFVTIGFFSGRSVHMGAAPLLYAGPFIWPVLAVAMVGSGLEDSRSESARLVQAHQGYEENMAGCPAGLEKACGVYFARDESFLRDKVGHSWEEALEGAREELFAYLLADRLPADPKERQLVVRMATDLCILSYRLSDNEMALAPLLGAEAPASARYVAACVLHAAVRLDIRDVKQSPEESGDAGRRMEQARVLKRILEAYADYFAGTAPENTDLELAVLYQAYAERLPEGGEREEAEKSALAHYMEAAVSGENTFVVLCGIEGAMQYANSLDELEPFLRRVEASMTARDVPRRRWIGRESADMPLLLFADRFEPEDGTPEKFLVKKLFPKMRTAKERAAAAYYLLPIVTHKHYQDREEAYRDFCYSMYAKDREPEWLDVFFRLVADKHPESSGRVRFYQAERLFIEGKKSEARDMLYEYFLQKGAKNLAMRGRSAYDDPPAWSSTAEGWEFEQLADRTEAKARHEKERRERQGGQ